MLTPEQVEQALRAQVVWGGRIGTNLVELGSIDLDKLATALSRQHRLPAALGRHFDRGEPELQSKLPAELAERYSCVPLLRAGPGRAQVIVASLAPLDTPAVALVAEALEVAPSAIVQSVAGELRIRYHLERVYKIPRHVRFLRARGKTNPPFPQFEIDALAFEDSQVDVPVEAPPPPPSPPPPAEPLDEEPTDDFTDVRGELRARLEQRAASKSIAPPIATAEPDDDLRALEAIFDDSAVPESVVEDDSSGRERRRYVRTIDTPPSADSERSLGRIAIKRVQVPAPPLDEVPIGLTLGEATRAIRRSTDRDRVAELVCDTLFRFLLSCDAALVLVIRGDAAISWKGFARSGAALPEVAVPLDQPGLIPRVIERCQSCRLTATELGPIDQLLLVSLGAQSGDLVVVPVSISNRVMCVIAMATQPDTPPTTAESIAAAAGAAFARLMRNASR